MLSGTSAACFVELDRVLAVCVSFFCISIYTPSQLPQTCFSYHFFSPHSMYQLTDSAIEVILADWHPQKYRPLCTDVQQWIDSIELLCDLYGIPDIQRLRCALRFVEEEISTILRKVLAEARERVGPVHWNQFRSFLVAFDGKWDSITMKLPPTWIPQRIFGRDGRVNFPCRLCPGLCSCLPLTELPFYKKHPKRTAVVIGIVGGAVLTGATVAALSLVGLTSAGFAAGHANFTSHQVSQY